MAKKIINVGTVANDGTGDKLRDAFVKVKDNFDELYADKVDKETDKSLVDDLEIAKLLTVEEGAQKNVPFTGLATEQFVNDGLATKQAILDSSNIKTINGESVLGSGDIVIESGGQSWTEDASYEAFGALVIRKILGYYGGVGILPTELSENIGKYNAKVGGYTTVKEDATTFSGGATIELSQSLNPLSTTKAPSEKAVAVYVEDKFLEVGKNKFNSEFATDGKAYNNVGGIEISSPTSMIIGLQKVVPSTNYVISKDSGNGFGFLHFYDLAKNYLGSQSTLGSVVASDGDKTKKFTTPSNCEFIATWLIKGSQTFNAINQQIQLEIGVEKTEYEPRLKQIKKSFADRIIKPTQDDLDQFKIDTGVKFDFKLPNNLNKNEGSEDPSIFTASGSMNNLTQSFLDNNTTIYPNNYDKKRRLQGVASTGATFLSRQIEYEAFIKPSKISFGFWVLDTDIESVYGSKTMRFSILTRAGRSNIFMFPIRNVISSVGNEYLGTVTGAVTDINGSWKAKCIDKKDGWSYVAFTLYDLIWAADYTQSYLTFYLDFAAADIVGKKMDYIGMTWLFNHEISSSNVYPDADGKSQFPNTLISVAGRVAKVENIIASNIKNEKEGKLIVLRKGNNIYVRSKFDESRDLIQTMLMNEPVEFGWVYLIEKTKGNSVAEWTTNYLELLQNNGDDSAPNRYNGTYIGANHGLATAKKITSTAHGKTSVDIGSEWTDSLSRSYYIIRIINPNSLLILSANRGTAEVWDWTVPSGTVLTHSSGATNTANINYSAPTTEQVLPATKNIVKKVLLNGKKSIESDGVYYADTLDIVHDYDIVNPASMLDNLIANVGTNYTDESLDLAYRNGSAQVSNKILYRFQSDGNLQIIYGWRNYQEINLDYVGFMQNGTTNTLTLPKLKLYIPKILPKTIGGKNWNFRAIEDYDTGTSTDWDVTSEYWEDILSPPERAVKFLCNASGVKKVGFAMGYDLTSGIGAKRKDMVNSAWQLFPTRKMYPKGIDSKLNPFTTNKMYSMIGYRIFFNAENPKMGLSSVFYHYKIGNDVIVVFDYHTSVDFDTLQLPSEYVGRSVTIVEKSDNMTVHTEEVMQNGLTVSVGSGAYAYCVVKISN